MASPLQGLQAAFRSSELAGQSAQSALQALTAGSTLEAATSGLAPRTHVATTHALELRFGAIRIGACFKFDFTENITVSKRREVHANARGRVRELVPQIVDFTLDIGRFDLFRQPFKALFAAPDGMELPTLRSLGGQGLRLYEVMVLPTGLFAPKQRVEYSPVMFESFSRPQSAMDGRVIQCSARATVGVPRPT